MARIDGTDWVGSIRRKMEREAQRGTTHLLLIQRDGESISLAALVPIDDVTEIWRRQRDESERLIRAGALGRRRKNHAMNGKSPTLWLADQRGGQSVADILWNYAGVIDLSGDTISGLHEAIPEEVRDPSLYVEGAVRTVTVNAYERDRRARNACIAHHGTRCVVCGFSFGETYGDLANEHIHVHHIVPLAEVGGSYEVDPIDDLRPVCANCHSVIHLGGGCRSIDDVREMLGRDSVHGRPSTARLKLTSRQGQYLAFIHLYTRLHRRAPSHADMQEYFHASAPVVNDTLKALQRGGCIARDPGTARSIRLLVPPHAIPELE
jgi:hypothetical protein